MNNAFFISANYLSLSLLRQTMVAKSQNLIGWFTPIMSITDESIAKLYLQNILI